MKAVPFAILLILSSAVSATVATKLAPFTSDGCSRWPDGLPWKPKLWRECCFKHDIAYWKGGPRSERRAADQELRQCVGDRDVIQGPIMWIGVRIGGKPWTHAPYRWGYGWPDYRGYQILSSEERRQVREQLDRNSFVGEELRWLNEYRAGHGL